MYTYIKYKQKSGRHTQGNPDPADRGVGASSHPHTKSESTGRTRPGETAAAAAAAVVAEVDALVTTPPLLVVLVDGRTASRGRAGTGINDTGARAQAADEALTVDATAAAVAATLAPEGAITSSSSSTSSTRGSRVQRGAANKLVGASCGEQRTG